jgi:hypothetical protein
MAGIRVAGLATNAAAPALSRTTAPAATKTIAATTTTPTSSTPEGSSSKTAAIGNEPTDPAAASAAVVVPNDNENEVNDEVWEFTSKGRRFKERFGCFSAVRQPQALSFGDYRANYSVQGVEVVINDDEIRRAKNRPSSAAAVLLISPFSVPYSCQLSTSANAYSLFLLFSFFFFFTLTCVCFFLLVSSLRICCGRPTIASRAPSQGSMRSSAPSRILVEPAAVSEEVVW